MTYLEFEKSLKEFPVFSIQDIQKAISRFRQSPPVEWQQKNYIQKSEGILLFPGAKARREISVFRCE
jgi:hypothetical protein